VCPVERTTVHSHMGSSARKIVKKRKSLSFPLFLYLLLWGMTAHSMANWVLVNSVGGTHNGMSNEYEKKHPTGGKEKMVFSVLTCSYPLLFFLSLMMNVNWSYASSFVLYPFSCLFCLVALVFFLFNSSSCVFIVIYYTRNNFIWNRNR